MNVQGTTQVGHTAAANDPNPKTILVLSGGGMYGAYSAGVINGWTKAGNRPVFDVVTGISTGALIAPLAFLGPHYDGVMERVYTQVRQKDIFTYHSWATVPFRSAAANATPLREILNLAITDAMIEELAAAHKQGRRLYIGTTNLDTKRFVTWDIGAIACQGGPGARKLVTDILVATCSLPGVFPPVPITVEVDGKKYTELHMDGGVIAPLFVPQTVLETAKPKSQVFVVQAIKSYVEPFPVRARVLQVLGASAGAVLTAQTRREVSNLYHQSRNLGLDFKLAALPDEFPTPAGGLEFDKKEMNKLFEKGFEFGVAGNQWKTAPPERGPGETDPIRTGTSFQRSK